eukprot:Gregarina_sp_Poly_1__1073@NODE_1262_length_4582_cov_113_342193_g857_i0_p3_GENE_NODE_1262_length_4582_cov_113_342193_g857_i0NODE_1262_length_4582_cov_113_342193_g857_i0_p3_ORF_typecomplete_len230_score14_50Pkinase/PF00069_25/4_5e29Pkinase_Tyr/PF07714_17/1_6e19Kinaselike/PF14531_6/0_0012Kdo/PF06293_14/0_0049FTA2/PF13095_6/1_9_NODE_1262_length_4582_cov_113_342193_g857_i037504439
MSHGASRPYMEPLSSYSTSTSIRESEDAAAFKQGNSCATDHQFGSKKFAFNYFLNYHSASLFATQPNVMLNRSMQWSFEHRKYQCLKQLGCGTYGTVYKAERRDRGEQHNAVAMKVCRIDQSPELGLPETAVREAALLIELRGHPNIMNLLNISCSRADKLYLVCELLDMDLKAYIRRSPTRRLPIKETQHISRCLLRGLAYCHSRGVLHRDLKPVSLFERFICLGPSV